jgi:hypothetical protein
MVDLKAAIEKFKDYIMRETLADDLIEVEDMQDGVEFIIDNQKIIIKIEKIE